MNKRKRLEVLAELTQQAQELDMGYGPRVGDYQVESKDGKTVKTFTGKEAFNEAYNFAQKFNGPVVVLRYVGWREVAHVGKGWYET